MREPQVITPKPIYFKGQKFSCRQCGARLFELTRDVYPLDPIVSDMFSFTTRQQKEIGDQMICNECGVPYFAGGYFQANQVDGEVWN